MFSFKEIEKVIEPFPYVFINQPIDDKSLDNLINEFPSEEEFRDFENVMGGRRRLPSDDPEFYSFIEKSNSWKAFFNEINSEEFINQAFKLFRDDFEIYDSAIDNQNFEFDKDFLRKRALKKDKAINKAYKTNVSLVSSKLLLKIIMHRIVTKLSGKVLRIKPNKSKTNLYVHFDISAAHNGYFREIHHDNDNRVVAMVFYLSDHNKDNRVGGEFSIYKYKSFRNLSLCDAHPKEEEMVEVKKIIPRKNQGIIFLSTPNSYHSVPLIKNAEKWRKFIYIGISVDNPKAWKNSKNSYES